MNINVSYDGCIKDTPWSIMPGNGELKKYDKPWEIEIIRYKTLLELVEKLNTHFEEPINLNIRYLYYGVKKINGTIHFGK